MKSNILASLVSLALLATTAGAQTPVSATPVGPLQPASRGDRTDLGDRPRIGTTRLATTAVALTYATHAPFDTTRLYICEQRGRILVMDLGTGTVNPTAFLDIDSLVIGSGNERGLLGLAFHPDFQNNSLFYVHYNRNGDGDTVIAEYFATNADKADVNSERIVMIVDQPQSNHNGGWIGFGPLDGYLYIALGDGGNFCDTGTGHTAGIGNAQDITSNLLGKMLRIDPTGAVPYAIPPSNPFVGVSGDDEIWSFGLRNPWRCSFDQLTGDLYIGDVGQDIREEISFQPGLSTGGENYGWRCREGFACASAGASNCPTVTGCTCPGSTPGLTLPIHEMSHQSPPAPAGFICSVVGGYAYRGATFPQLEGHYLFADFCGNAVWSMKVVDGVKTLYRDRTSQLTPTIEGVNISGIRSFGEDAAGEMYIVANGVFKIVERP